MQHTVSKSSFEAKYRVMAHTTAELTWISFILCNLCVHLTSLFVLFRDNLSALYRQSVLFFVIVYTYILYTYSSLEFIIINFPCFFQLFLYTCMHGLVLQPAFKYMIGLLIFNYCFWLIRECIYIAYYFAKFIQISEQIDGTVCVYILLF